MTREIQEKMGYVVERSKKQQQGFSATTIPRECGGAGSGGGGGAKGGESKVGGVGR